MAVSGQDTSLPTLAASTGAFSRLWMGARPASGLAIAIPVNIAYNFFVSRIDTLILDMEQGSQRVLNLAWDLEKEGRLTVVGKDEVARQLAERVAAALGA